MIKLDRSIADDIQIELPKRDGLNIADSQEE
jgi:hypothetical protein